MPDSDPIAFGRYSWSDALRLQRGLILVLLTRGRQQPERRDWPKWNAAQDSVGYSSE